MCSGRWIIVIENDRVEWIKVESRGLSKDEVELSTLRYHSLHQLPRSYTLSRRHSTSQRPAWNSYVWDIMFGREDVCLVVLHSREWGSWLLRAFSKRISCSACEGLLRCFCGMNGVSEKMQASDLFPIIDTYTINKRGVNKSITGRLLLVVHSRVVQCFNPLFGGAVDMAATTSWYYLYCLEGYNDECRNPRFQVDMPDRDVSHTKQLIQSLVVLSSG